MIKKQENMIWRKYLWEFAKINKCSQAHYICTYGICVLLWTITLGINLMFDNTIIHAYICICILGGRYFAKCTQNFLFDNKQKHLLKCAPLMWKIANETKIKILLHNSPQFIYEAIICLARFSSSMKHWPISKSLKLHSPRDNDGLHSIFRLTLK